MEIGKYKLEVEDGIIKITPPTQEYYQIAESIANEIAESGTEQWQTICLKIINILDNSSKMIKGKIINKVSYGTGYHPISMESVKQRKFEEAKAYIDGYTEAVNQFKIYFEGVEQSLIKALNDVLPNQE